MRGDAALGILERCAISKTDQREELVELAVAVDGEGASAQCRESDDVLGDDGGEEDAHAVESNRTNTKSTKPRGPRNHARHETTRGTKPRGTKPRRARKQE